MLVSACRSLRVGGPAREGGYLGTSAAQLVGARPRYIAEHSLPTPVSGLHACEIPVILVIGIVSINRK